MFGLLVVGTFATVVLAYLCTEYLLMRLDVRRRVLVGDRPLLIPILYANGASFLLVCVTSLMMLFVIGGGAPAYTVTVLMLICLCAQGVWLGQHLWFYHRHHLRLRYNNGYE